MFVCLFVWFGLVWMFGKGEKRQTCIKGDHESGGVESVKILGDDVRRRERDLGGVVVDVEANRVSLHQSGKKVPKTKSKN